MGNFEVKIDASELIEKLGRSQKKISGMLNILIDTLQADAEKEAIEGCPVSHGWLPEFDGKNVSVRKRRSGMLRMSLKRGGTKNYYRRDESRHTVEFGTNLKYAPSILENTDPYTIRPKRKKFLWFALGPKSSDIVYTKKVTHPGGKAITGKGGDATLPRVAKATERNAPSVLDMLLRNKELFE